jgi:hypothetical protein
MVASPLPVWDNEQGCVMALNPNSNPLGCRGFRRAMRPDRRQLLQVGALSALGLGLSDFHVGLSRAGLVSQAGLTAGEPRRRPAKACIFLFMWGGPSQLETFDLKPHAPPEVRGEFKPLSTKVPGTQICEHFSQLAQLTDKLAAYPISDPVSPQDFATTILHALGLPTHETLLDREQRPHRIASGKVIPSLLS